MRESVRCGQLRQCYVRDPRESHGRGILFMVMVIKPVRLLAVDAWKCHVVFDAWGISTGDYMTWADDELKEWELTSDA